MDAPTSPLIFYCLRCGKVYEPTPDDLEALAAVERELGLKLEVARIGGECEGCAEAAEATVQ